MGMAKALLAAGADALVFDTADGPQERMIEVLLAVRALDPPVPIVAGNVATAAGVNDLVAAGADIVKVFPATSLGPAFFKDVRAPLPQVKLMPTGGVSIENAGEWIRAGAVAVGAGSALLDPKAIAGGAFASITGNARRLVSAVAAARAGQ